MKHTSCSLLSQCTCITMYRPGQCREGHREGDHLAIGTEQDGRVLHPSTRSPLLPPPLPSSSSSFHCPSTVTTRGSGREYTVGRVEQSDQEGGMYRSVLCFTLVFRPNCKVTRIRKGGQINGGCCACAPMDGRANVRLFLLYIPAALSNLEDSNPTTRMDRPELCTGGGEGG